jgi:CPA1 family monovalent cation:H+ antiporter
MNLNIERVEVLLLIAASVAMMARRFKLPYTVGLVLAGTVLAVFPNVANLTLTKELVFTVFLPPLIFEAAFQMDWSTLRRDLPVTLTLATLGVLLAAGLTAAGIHFLLGWEWQTAVLLGVLISATDPVSVIATFKETGVPGRLRLLVEAESLFNDGTAAVLFSVALAAISGAALTGWQVTFSFLVTFGGGILCGGLIGWLVLRVAGHTEDHLVEITFSTIAAYGSFLIAEHFHLSGVMATLTAGILFGNYGSCGILTDRGREAVLSFWEYVAFVANSLLFLLIGVRLTQQHFGEVWLPVVVVIALVLLSRAIAVYGCCAPFVRSSQRVARSHQHILVWGGLRGALALALVFGLPAEVPHRASVETVVFGVVAFSVLVQGLTIPWLLKRLDLLPPQPHVEWKALPAGEQEEPSPEESA